MTAGREALEGWLRNHSPEDEAERDSLRQMAGWLGRLTSPFDRASREAHFTGSALVVSRTGDRVCLLHHRALDRWLQPGGHGEPADGGDLLVTALREAREETGLDVRPHPRAAVPFDVDVHAIPAKAATPAHLHLDVRFLLEATTDAAPQRDARESLEVAFFDWKQAEALASDASLRRLLRKARQLLSAP